jgi:hypothetical protein
VAACILQQVRTVLNAKTYHLASSNNWDSKTFKYIGNNITISGGNNGVYQNTVYLTDLDASASSYEVYYFFLVTSVGYADVSPIIDIASGNQIKFSLSGTLDSRKKN